MGVKTMLGKVTIILFDFYIYSPSVWFVTFYKSLEIVKGKKNLKKPPPVVLRND